MKQGEERRVGAEERERERAWDHKQQKDTHILWEKGKSKQDQAGTRSQTEETTNNKKHET